MGGERNESTDTRAATEAPREPAQLPPRAITELNTLNPPGFG